MCTKVNLEDLKTIHQLMAQIQYYMSYSHQPTVFRDSAFLDAVGDTIVLSVQSEQHLLAISLIDKTQMNTGDEEEEQKKRRYLDEPSIETFFYCYSC